MDIIPDWLRESKTNGVEIRVSWNNYYAYDKSSKWNCKRWLGFVE
jgi:hypothetical protein